MVYSSPHYWTEMTIGRYKFNRAGASGWRGLRRRRRRAACHLGTRL